MASKELIRAVESYDNYVLNYPVIGRPRNKSEQDDAHKVIDAYIQATMAAITEKDIDYALGITSKGKKVVSDYILNFSDCYFRQLEEYAQANDTMFDIIDYYYELLKLEGRYLLDSYALYIERNRKRKERFYEPRRNTLKRVVDKLQMLENDELDELFVHQPPRTGKALPLDELVLTPDGYVEMKDIHVGTKVISGRGTICNVIGVYPQGEKDVYKITFADGTYVECCKEHLWRVQTKEDRRVNRRKDKTEKYRIVQTQDMIGKTQYISQGKVRNKYFIDYIKPVQFEKKNLPLHPYVLGVLLGDGSFKTSIQLCNEEKDIVERVKKLLPDDCYMSTYKKNENRSQTYGLNGNVKRIIDELGLGNTRSETKFIPKDYLLSTVEDRIMLLRGLCDTDGFVDGNSCGDIDYSTASKQLAEDIMFLAQSLGCRVSMITSDSHYMKDGERVECKKRYRLFINTNKKFVPVCSEKHLAKYDHSKRKAIKKAIVSIEFSRKAECQCIMVDDESHLFVTRGFNITHNTQIMTDFMAWHCCRNMELSNLYATYKESLGGAFLIGVNEIWTDPTYAHKDIFPETKIVSTDANNHKIDLGRKKKYQSLSGKGLESGLNGEYDATGVLVIDDILEGIKDVLNPEILKRKQTVFDNNLMSRKKEKCKVVYNGTIWSLKDIFMDRVNFLESNPAASHIRWDILKLPALNENDKSNFEYDYNVGFTSRYYITTRSKFEDNDDIASWMAQYQQEPIERDGAVFTPENMKFYNGVLPNEEPYRICAACDVALGGGDFLSMPVAYCYENGDVYIHDVVFDNQEKKFTKPQVVEKLITNNCGSAFFESNQGGEGYKDEIDAMLRERNVKINMTSKYAPSNMRKEQRIWDKAGSIREMYFRDPSCRDNQYKKFMLNVYSFTMTGNHKKKHDDAPDSLATLAAFIEGSWAAAKVEVVKNPFRAGFGG